MRIVCAWCNKVIGGKGTVLSHGICKKCFAQMKQPQFDFMQALPVSPTEPPRVRPARHRGVRSEGWQQPSLTFLG